MNPYNFERMEWWVNRNKDKIGYACVGFSGDEVHMTFDIRKRKNGLLYPVFSPICKVGAPNGHRRDAYTHYRELFRTLDGYNIYSAQHVPYQILHDKKIYKFEI